MRAALVSAGTVAFRLASRVRGERAIHNRGRALTGRLTVSGGAGTGVRLLDEPASYDVLLRLSRSVGLPSRLPDILGLAVRMVDAHGPDAHQDLLLDSTLALPLLRHLPVPRFDHLGVTYGSLFSHDVGGRRLLVGARALPGSLTATTLDEVPPDVGLALLVATPYGPWQQVGVLRADGELPAPQGRRIRFSPVNFGGGLGPPKLLASWRVQAYPATHVGPDA